MTLDPKLAKKLERSGAADKVFECTWKGKPAAAVFGVDRLALIGLGFGADVAAPFGFAHIVERDGPTRWLKFFGMQETVTFADAGTAHDFDQALETRNADAGQVA